MIRLQWKWPSPINTSSEAKGIEYGGFPGNAIYFTGGGQVRVARGIKRGDDDIIRTVY